MDLLEREAALEELDAALDAAARGEGRVALVSGEAGIGKTALIEQFVRAAPMPNAACCGARATRSSHRVRSDRCTTCRSRRR